MFLSVPGSPERIPRAWASLTQSWPGALGDRQVLRNDARGSVSTYFSGQGANQILELRSDLGRSEPGLVYLNLGRVCFNVDLMYLNLPCGQSLCKRTANTPRHACDNFYMWISMATDSRSI